MLGMKLVSIEWVQGRLLHHVARELLQSLCHVFDGGRTVFAACTSRSVARDAITDLFSDAYTVRNLLE
jgi:hypothetical protein